MNIIIAGGGTGGHLFPGVAIAEEFLKRDSHHRVLFIGTERGLEKRVLGEMGYPLRILNIEGIKGKGLKKALAAAGKIPWSMWESSKIIGEFQPDIVIGVGGYASGPAVLTACIRGIKTAIAEQNAFPGLTNRILGRFVDKVFLSFEGTKGWFSEKKTIVTGNPIRMAFLGEQKTVTKDSKRFTVLVFGGSQGAKAINKAVIDSLEHLHIMKEQLQFMHQTGSNDLDQVKSAYRDKGIKAEVMPFIMDMASAYQMADLLICRAGATSIAEITASGKAAILIPFPYAVNDHQTKNAEVLVRAGAACMIPEKELNGKRLAEALEDFCLHKEKIKDMETASTSLGNKRAAADIVDACFQLLSSG